jgi:hypothetical protein
MFLLERYDDYSVGEYLVLACYFARNIIHSYENLDGGVQNAFDGDSSTQMTGKCTDYTALALHYLREFLVPLNSEKFEGWQFGVELKNIGSYRHSYIKAYRIGQQNVDIFYVDPTKLADEGIFALRTPEEVTDFISTENHPLLIDRDAEDLLRKNN